MSENRKLGFIVMFKEWQNLISKMIMITLSSNSLLFVTTTNNNNNNSVVDDDNVSSYINIDHNDAGSASSW